MAATPITGFPFSSIPPPDDYVFVLADPAGVHLSANYKIRYGDLKLAFGGAGSQGAAGPAGMSGEDGEDGFIIPGGVGPQGPAGLQGIQGIAGIAGAIGLNGEDGDDGLPGPPGAAGAAGAAGTNGTIGRDGNPGLAGDDGEDGWMIPAIQGPQGNPGTPGTNGSIGVNGINGFDGEDGIDGFNVPGTPGVNGTNGAAGAAGPVGPMMVVEDQDFSDPSITSPPNTPYIGVGQSPPAVADQAITAATLTLITGSKISIPDDTFRIGQKFKWIIYGTKTAAGTAANTITVKIGTAGTTADGTVASFTTGLGTAVVDTWRIEIELTVRTLGAAATASAHCFITHGLQTTGFLVIPCAVIAGTMSTFNSTVRALFANVSITTGAAVAPTVQECFAEVFNPS